MGERKTPQAFVTACDRFIYLDLLGESAEDADDAEDVKEAEPQARPPALRRILTAAIEGTSQDDGWSHLGSVGTHLSKSHPSFDPRDYGHTKLSNLVKAQSYVEVRMPDASSPGPVLVRLKPAGRSARTR
ncbi:MAG: OST-HTH/LOTUS domain-containing protein [Nocardioides sp.]